MNSDAIKPILVRVIRHLLTVAAGALGVSAASGGLMDALVEGVVSLVLAGGAIAWSEWERRKKVFDAEMKLRGEVAVARIEGAEENAERGTGNAEQEKRVQHAATERGEDGA